MVKNQSSYSFVIDSLVKQSVADRAQPVLTLSKFAEDQILCAFTTLEEYIKRTEPIRNSEPQLFISIIKSFKKVSKDTTGRWIKNVMKSAYINLQAPQHTCCFH